MCGGRLRKMHRPTMAWRSALPTMTPASGAMRQAIASLARRRTWHVSTRSCTRISRVSFLWRNCRVPYRGGSSDTGWKKPRPSAKIGTRRQSRFRLRRIRRLSKTARRTGCRSAILCAMESACAAPTCAVYRPRRLGSMRPTMSITTSCRRPPSIPLSRLPFGARAQTASSSSFPCAIIAAGWRGGRSP